MKALIPLSLLLVSTASLAHDSNFNSDSCNVDLEGGIRINQQAITFSKNQKPLYKIVNNNDLYINDNLVKLSSSQQSLVTEYSYSIRAIVPAVKEVAIDAIDLATDGVNLAFNELLGEGNDVGSEVSMHLADVKVEIETRFSPEQEFYIDENGFSEDEYFGEEFEAKIERTVEKVVENSLGTIMIAVGQELLFAGGNMDAFETRMERFGEQIEEEMEARGESLEKRGEALCEAAIEIDNLEEQLKSEVIGLSHTNVIVAHRADHNNI